MIVPKLLNGVMPRTDSRYHSARAGGQTAKAADAFDLLKYAEDQSTRLCPEVDKFLSMAPRLKRRSGQIRTRQGRRAEKKDA